MRVQGEEQMDLGVPLKAVHLIRWLLKMMFIQEVLDRTMTSTVY